jgi:hypothetical protein
MLGGVDAIAVDAETVDPAAVNVDKPGQNARIFRRQIVQPGKVPVIGALALERAVAPVMIPDRIVQPRRVLHLLLARRDIGV